MSDATKRPDGMLMKATGAFKALDDAGGFSGYANPFGKLDTVGDITMPGAFAGCIAEFLTHGFIPDNHNWDDRVGYPTAAREDAYGLFIECRFHSTERGQRARIEAAERVAAGLSERMSIGFLLGDFEYVKGADAVQYLIDPTPEEIERCASMARVRLIHSVKQLFEVSLVSVPAAPGSDVIGVKSDGTTPVDTAAVDPATDTTETTDATGADAKGVHLGEYIEQGVAMSAVENLIERLVWRVVWEVVFGSDGIELPVRMDLLNDGLEEFQSEVMRIVGALLALDPNSPDVDEAKADLAAILEKSATTADASPAERRLADQSAEVLAAVADLSTRFRAVLDLRLKAGRRHSRATTERITANETALREHAAHILERADDLAAMLRDGDPGDDELSVIGGKSDTRTDGAPTPDTTATETDTATADEPEYVDAEVANGRIAAFTLTHGIHSNE